MSATPRTRRRTWRLVTGTVSLAAVGALWAGWRDLRELRHQERQGQPKIGQHFQRQVWLATLLWAGLVVGRGMG